MSIENSKSIEELAEDWSKDWGDNNKPEKPFQKITPEENEEVAELQIWYILYGDEPKHDSLHHGTATEAPKKGVWDNVKKYYSDAPDNSCRQHLFKMVVALDIEERRSFVSYFQEHEESTP